MTSVTQTSNLQSSGFGKSRLADEILKLIFTIRFRYRTESNGLNLPPH